MNCGRDTIGSLPFYAYLYILDAPFLVRPRISFPIREVASTRPYAIGREIIYDDFLDRLSSTIFCTEGLTALSVR
jgi:hypothetical protein